MSGDEPEVVAEIRFEQPTGDSWSVLRADLHEAVSRLEQHLVRVATDATSLELNELLGRRVTLELTRRDVARRVHGIVRAVSDHERMPDGRWVIDLAIVPELWLLSKRRDTRIFADLDVPTIVRRVLDAAGIYPGDRLVLRLDSSPDAHRPREYCVQYRETDLDFVQRLLEEEGTCFYLRSTEDDERERLVLADPEVRHADDTFPRARSSRGDELEIVAPGEQSVTGREGVIRFDETTRVEPRSATLRDPDFTRYGDRAAATHRRSIDGQLAELPVYEHPGRFTFEQLDDRGGFPIAASLAASTLEHLTRGRGGWLAGGSLRLLDDVVAQTLAIPMLDPLPSYGRINGARVAGVRLDELRADAVRFHGDTDVVSLAAGHRFDLVGHPRESLDRAYLALRVVHRFRAPDDQHAHAGSDVEQRYANEVDCVPLDVAWRPARTTARPSIPGTQTATVIGGEGEEMHVDRYGRVRVQFHWDRADPALVCWARCAQSWAGPHWGSVFLPRVGMEVVVTFLDGDPDRPLVVGCVYNSANPPPYDLPREHHRSTIKSRSIPAAMKLDGREGFNEIRFDDLAEREEIFVHAEKDLTMVVRDHHESYIGGAQDTEIRSHQTTHVAGSQLEGIGADQTHTVGGDQEISVSGNRSLVVSGTENRTASAGRSTSATTYDVQTVQGVVVHYVAPQGGPGADQDSDVQRVSDALGGNGVAATETWVVHGDRVKHVVGRESVELGSRVTTVHGADTTNGSGPWVVSARDNAGINVTGGTVAAGLSLSTGSAPETRVGLGGDRLSFQPDTTRLNRGQSHVQIEQGRLLIEAVEGIIALGKPGTGANPRILLNVDEDKVLIRTAECTIRMHTAGIQIFTESQSVGITNNAGSTIELDGGTVTITASTINLNGHVNMGGS